MCGKGFGANSFSGEALADILIQIHHGKTYKVDGIPLILGHFLSDVANVVYAKISKLVDRGLLDYGVSLRCAFLTEEGQHQLNILLERSKNNG